MIPKEISFDQAARLGGGVGKVPASSSFRPLQDDESYSGYKLIIV